MSQEKRLTRSQRDKKIGGVCAGLAEYLGIDATIIRLIFVVLLFTGGPGLILYLALWLILPQGPSYS
ncbi:PspC domain-containing protein [Truepera radiovictrix]|uniref:Phage shock protein C, PspC n=1 Tax=Truepera radiovictrix (strain DSM 17093 / CIP 108686 / LMG 22925 / RQ-24) TaxID=649638 RepID=D7CR31_TRURR|nr:PspC domain-containing protein [Truepera radiovictrix]ADI13431.1 phage shock protein C, PspC [Truepera radiovictrix DSM 17093]WMT58008.1 PspC domain-containing protein [Truepera radiovictrix]